MTPPRAHALWAAGLGAGLIASLGVLAWLDTTQEPSANLILLPVLGLITVIAVWTGVWAMISRIFVGQARFSLQLRIALTACIVLVLWDQLSELLSFSFAWRGISEYAGLGAWVLLTAACWAHLRSIGPRHMRMAMGLVVALICTGAALHILGKSESRKLDRPARHAGRPAAARVPPRAARERRRFLQEGRAREGEGRPGAREGARLGRPLRRRLARLGPAPRAYGPRRGADSSTSASCDL